MRRAITGGVAAALCAGLLAGSAGSVEIASLPTFTVEQLLAIATVDAPPEGIGLQIHADFPEEAPLEIDGLEIYSFTADITPEGGVLTRSAVTSANTTDEHTPTVGECDDPTFAPLGVTWQDGEMPIPWRLNLHSVPTYMDDAYTLIKIRKAHHVWPRARSNCDGKEASGFGYKFGGSTRKHPAYDDVNVIDFGKLGGGSLAINYTWYSGTRILEVDLRLNKVDHKWTNQRRRHRYHVRNVVAHELGHQIGLDDLSDPHRALTMFGRIGKGETSKITLGRGDLRGAATLSP